MNRETLIKVDNISRYYGDHCAVNDVSFTVQRGEVLGFLGPNGAGKSTSMQIICGIVAASSGTVSIAGEDIREAPKSAKTHIGFLPEQPPLYTDLSVDDYLHYTGQLRRIPPNKMKDALENCKERCGLKDAGKRLIRNLSKGYQQRVGIAQAIIHTPAIVILDEPTSGLDPNQIVEIRELISELGSDHSVILSTHILPEVQSTCDRVIIIDEGKLVLDEYLNALEEDNEEKSFRVALQQPQVIEELEGIGGVTKVTRLGEQHFQITYRLENNTAVLLTETAANAGWGLYELIPNTNNLEQTFIQLTQGETNNSEISQL